MASRPKPEPGSTVDAAEVAQFSAYAAEWWDPRGKMAMLHRFNPVRLAFIKQSACRHFERDGRRLDALAGRYLHAEHDDVDDLARRAGEIVENDLNAIRLQR